MSTPHVYTAICAVMTDIGHAGIAKGRKNAQQGYNFRGIDDVYNELNGLLSKHKLVMTPRILSRDVVERQSAKGGALFYVTVEAEFEFISAEDGSKHVVRTFGEAMDSADKATNKAMSAAYKYAAMMVFCIPTEGDNDADAVTHEVAPLPKKDARDTYTILEKDMRQNKTKADLRRWIADPDVKKLRNSMPADWDANLRQAAADFGRDLPDDVPVEEIFPGDMPMPLPTHLANSPQRPL